MAGVAVRIPLRGVLLDGDLHVPSRATGVVVFAHGSGSSRLSRRNQFVAEYLRRAGLGTLLFDLLTPEEEAIDEHTRHLRFDIELLADRLAAVTEWLKKNPSTSALRIGYFGASTGAAAALVAAARLSPAIRAVVSRGGRPDLAGELLPRVTAPTLLVVGGRDETVIALNEAAKARLVGAKVGLEVVPGATHLFEEPGALEKVAQLARDWFSTYLGPAERDAGLGSPRTKASPATPLRR